jgi:hypothetical protein
VSLVDSLRGENEMTGVLGVNWKVTCIAACILCNMEIGDRQGQVKSLSLIDVSPHSTIYFLILTYVVSLLLAGRIAKGTAPLPRTNARGPRALLST